MPLLPRYYDLLSILPNATDEEIAAARDTLLAKYQPHARLGDRDAVRLTQAIEEAAATLSNPTRRAAYDAALAVVTSQPSPVEPGSAIRQARRASTPPASGTSRPRSLPAPAAPTPLASPSRTAPLAKPSDTHSGASDVKALALPSKVDENTPPAPILLVLLILDWLAKRFLELRDGAGQVGEVFRPAAPALPPPTVDSIQVSAADWRFVVHDAFFTPALAMNGQRLAANGKWLLVRLGIHNDWSGHRALRADDFGLMITRQASDVSPMTEVQHIGLNANATHAARLTLGLKATPAGRHGLGFGPREGKETVLVFDMPSHTVEAYLRMKPTGAIVDLAPVAPLSLDKDQGVYSTTVVEGRAGTSQTTTLVPRLEIVDIQQAVGRGRSQQVTVTARATPGAECHIRVQYARGPSTARGLEPAIAGPDGLVRWSWRITSRTRPGEWPVTVACGYTHALGSIVVDAPHHQSIEAVL